MKVSLADSPKHFVLFSYKIGFLLKKQHKSRSLTQHEWNIVDWDCKPQFNSKYGEFILEGEKHCI